jgi:uncharacterized protein (DUF427 family)
MFASIGNRSLARRVAFGWEPKVRNLERSKMVRATWNDTVIAESDRTVVVEGNHYFPASDVRREYLQPSDSHTVCPWKGTASYYNLEIDGVQNPDAAWYYPDTKPAATRVKDRIAFWHGVKVEADDKGASRWGVLGSILKR